MKSLLEHNAEALERFNWAKRVMELQAGVGCPKCGAEMFYEDASTVTASIPPKRYVRCSCGYRDLKL